MYKQEHLLNNVWSERVMPGIPNILKPDIMDFTLKQIAEIKPLSVYGVATGHVQLGGYLLAANAFLGGGWSCSKWDVGIRNVLALTGDHTTMGDHPDARPVFDLDSVQLLWTIKRLEEGYDLAGNELTEKPSFFKGAVVNPGADSEAAYELQIPDAHFFLVDRLFAFDHTERKAYAIVCPGARRAGLEPMSR